LSPAPPPKLGAPILGASILAPHWTRPALLGPDRTFQAILAAHAIERPAFALVQGAEQVPAQLENVTPVRPGQIACRCVAPEAKPGALHDLELRYKGGRSWMPRAAHVSPENRRTLTLLHCTDLHLLVPDEERGMVDRSALLAALVSRINALRPELVVCTGDVVSRYDEQKRVLPPETIRWQIRRAVELLALIEVPFYLTLGNHDVAFADTRGDWYAAMGGGWNGGTDDYSLDWGGYHLVMLDCFAHYDRQNVVQRHSFTEQQLDWLRADLAATPEGQRRLVFAHYDYRQQLPALLPELRLDALFYGHAKGMYPDVLAAHGIWDGHLADTMAYNLVRLTPQGIAAEKVSWASLVAQDPGLSTTID
jgi:hypothetical protein